MKSQSTGQVVRGENSSPIFGSLPSRPGHLQHGGADCSFLGLFGWVLLLPCGAVAMVFAILFVFANTRRGAQPAPVVRMPVEMPGE